VSHRSITFDEEAIVLWIEDRLIDVVTGEGPNAV
jgi:hypothetical protein